MFRKLEIRFGGMLLLSLMVFILDGSMLVALWGNIVIHEWGHLYMLRRYGVYIRKITLDFTGLCIVCNREYLNRRRKFICAAAGPFVGISVSVLSSILGNVLRSDFLLLYAGVGVILSVFNLLPIKPLDGGQMLESIAPKFVQPVGAFCSACVLLFGLYVMYLGYGTGLAILGVFLLFRVDRDVGKHRM